MDKFINFDCMTPREIKLWIATKLTGEGLNNKDTLVTHAVNDAWKAAEQLVEKYLEECRK
jgi:hypothetical protein